MQQDKLSAATNGRRKRKDVGIAQTSHAERLVGDFSKNK